MVRLILKLLQSELKFMKNKNIKKINIDRKNDFRFEVANLITEARYHYKLTQAQLAKKMGTQQPSIARVESGSILPSLTFLETLADSLDTYLIAPKFGFMEDRARNITLHMNIAMTSVQASFAGAETGNGVESGYYTIRDNKVLATQ